MLVTYSELAATVHFRVIDVTEVIRWGKHFVARVCWVGWGHVHFQLAVTVLLI